MMLDGRERDLSILFTLHSDLAYPIFNAEVDTLEILEHWMSYLIAQEAVVYVPDFNAFWGGWQFGHYQHPRVQLIECWIYEAEYSLREVVEEYGNILPVYTGALGWRYLSKEEKAFFNSDVTLGDVDIPAQDACSGTVLLAPPPPPDRSWEPDESRIQRHGENAR